MDFVERSADEEQRQAAVNLTPMVDVVFQLILFFLTVSQLSDLQVAPEVRLPQARSASERSRAAPGRIVVNVTAAGDFVVEGRKFAAGDFALLLEREAKVLRGLSRPTEPEVLVRCDREVPYERVEGVLAACVRLGVTDILFQTLRPDER